MNVADRAMQRMNKGGLKFSKEEAAAFVFNKFWQDDFVEPFIDTLFFPY